MKKAILLVLYNAVVIVILFLLLEGAVRIFVPGISLSGTSSNLIVDSLYNGTPGIKSNTRGTSGGIGKTTNSYHSWKYSKPLYNDLSKILYLGDSVTMGISVENDSTFAGIINNSTNSCDIVNPSLIGYSSHDYFNLFMSFVEKNRFNLRFSSVVLFWTLNDVYSNYPDRNAPEFSGDGILNSIVNFFRQNSKAYHFLKNLFSDRPRAYFEYDRQFYAENNKLLKSSLENLKYISAVCDRMRIKFRVVLLPYEFQLRNYAVKDKAIQIPGLFYPQQLMKKKLKELDIVVVDLSEAFNNIHSNASDYYLYGDGIHFNRRGNKLIAGYLIRELKDVAD